MSTIVSKGNISIAPMLIVNTDFQSKGLLLPAGACLNLSLIPCFACFIKIRLEFNKKLEPNTSWCHLHYTYLDKDDDL